MWTQAYLAATVIRAPILPPGRGTVHPTTPLGTIRESSSSLGSTENPNLLPVQTDADDGADLSVMTHHTGQEAEPSSSLVMADPLRQGKGQLQKAEGAFQPVPGGEAGKAVQTQKAGAGQGLQSPSDTGSEAAESVALGSDLERQSFSTVASVMSEEMSEADTQPGSSELLSGELLLPYLPDTNCDL